MEKLITISPYLQGALQGMLRPSISPGLEGVSSRETPRICLLQLRSLTHDSTASEFALQHWIVFSWSIDEYRF